MPSTTATYRVPSESVVELLTHLCRDHVNFQVRWETRFVKTSDGERIARTGPISDDYTAPRTHHEIGWSHVHALVTAPLKSRILLSQFGEPLS